MSKFAHLPCRSCGHRDLQLILDLGATPLANALLHASQLDSPEATYPLVLVFCPHCALVQITETVPPEVLFRDYPYFSSYSDTALQNAAEISGRMIRARRLDATSLVIEVASNDGYLLKNYLAQGIPVLGIEPAVNIAQAANAQGIRTESEFFGAAYGELLQARGERADVMHANNVLAHVADLNGFVAGFALALKEGGVAIFEFPYVKDLVDRVEFDTIYHEHLCYYSLTAITALFRRHGLAVIDVERLPIHGGSLRVFATHAAGPQPVAAAVGDLLAAEAAWGMDQLAFYARFGAQVEALGGKLRALLAEQRALGRRIAVYGASAKGSTLLNTFGIGAETLAYVVDRSRAKQGLFTPGTHLKIYPPEKLLEDQPDLLLLLTWNFADEILVQQATYRERGGRFILPLPEPMIV